MLKDSKAFSGFSTNDLSKSLHFYRDILGLSVTEIQEMRLLQIDFSNGGSVMIYPKPNHEPATYTVLNFPVNNIDEVVEALTVKGVQFEQYTGEITTDTKGISRGTPNIAWFKDPSGNIISVLETE